MSAVFGRRRRLFGILAWTLLTAAAFGATPTQADTVTVSIDSARVMKLPERVATIVIGNPLIADATLQSGAFWSSPARVSARPICWRSTAPAAS